MMQYKITEGDNGGFAAALIDGELFTITDTHPAYGEICSRLRSGDETVRELFDLATAVASKFEVLTDRVTVLGGRLYFDGDVVHNALADQVLRFLDEGRTDWQPLVRFFEKASQNPVAHSREQLFDWLTKFDFAITDDGNFIAYKGVRSDGKGGYESISSGPGIVNGVPMNGHLGNNPGDIVTIARGRVVADPTIGCAVGLHAGTWEYASTFGSGATLTVSINPRDVVSVPTDCNSQKIRTCRYTVLDVTEGPISEAWTDAPEDDDEYGDIHEMFRTL